jgi:hypothetical protein
MRPDVELQLLDQLFRVAQIALILLHNLHSIFRGSGLQAKGIDRSHIAQIALILFHNLHVIF